MYKSCNRLSKAFSDNMNTSHHMKHHTPFLHGNICNLNLIEEDKLLGKLTINGVADNYLICSSNYSEETVNTALKIDGLSENTKQMFGNWSEDSNPILILFQLSHQ